MDLPFGLKIGGDGNRNVIPRYALTPRGRIKAETGRVSGTEGMVASAIEDDETGELTKREIINATRLSNEDVGLAIEKLQRLGYVHKVTSNAG